LCDLTFIGDLKLLLCRNRTVGFAKIKGAEINLRANWPTFWGSKVTGFYSFESNHIVPAGTAPQPHGGQQRMRAVSRLQPP